MIFRRESFYNDWMNQAILFKSKISFTNQTRLQFLISLLSIVRNNFGNLDYHLFLLSYAFKYKQ